MKYGMPHDARTIPLKQKTNSVFKVEQRYCYLNPISISTIIWICIIVCNKYNILLYLLIC